MTETVDQILASRKKGDKQPKSDLQKAIRKLRKIERLLDRLVAAACPEDHAEFSGDWEKIYDVVFSRRPEDIKLQTHAALELAGTSFPDYYDPDSSYESDVRAWIEAFKRVLEDLEAREASRDDD